MPASPPSLTDPFLSAKHFCPKQASNQATSLDAIFQTPWHKGSRMPGEDVNLRVMWVVPLHFLPMCFCGRPHSVTESTTTHPRSCSFKITTCQTWGGNHSPFLRISRYLLNFFGLNMHQSYVVITRGWRLPTLWLCKGPASGTEGLEEESIIVINSQFRLNSSVRQY